MKYLKYSLFILFPILFTSCDTDFLEVDTSKAGLSPEMISGNPDLIRQTLDGIYSQTNKGMGIASGYRNRVDLFYIANTDIERNISVKNTTSGNASNGAGLAFYTIDKASTGDGLAEVWESAYNNIDVCNQVIIGIDSLYTSNKTFDKSAFDPLYAEALAMRSFFYYDLVSLWGDVPARWVPLSVENEYISPVNRDEIYTHILSDLLKAATYMGNANSDITHLPNRKAIKAFRARVALSAAGYAQRPISQTTSFEHHTPDIANGFAFVGRVSKGKRDAYYEIAKTECAELIAEGLPLLSFEDIFKEQSKGMLGNSAKSEVLWSMNYRHQYIYGWGLKHNTAGTTSDGKTKTASPYLNGGKGAGTRGAAVANLYWDYASNDTRRNVTIPCVEWFDTLTPCKFSDVSFGKFRLEWASGNPNMIVNDAGDSFEGRVIIRAADVYLMHAEACLALDQAGEGKSSLDRIRDRAGLSSVDLTWENLMDERKFEFAGEPCIRKRDLVRWGTLKSAMDEARNRLEDLQAAHDGNSSIHGYDYSTVPKHVWWRYAGTKSNPDKTKIEFYGMNKGEILPEGETPAKGTGRDWMSFSMWSTPIAGGGSKNDVFYEQRFYSSSVNPDLRSLLPFSTTVITNSRGTIPDKLYGY